jgi:nucleoside-diphosphate-sugar epimerase
MKEELHVVFGSGQVGATLAERLLAGGYRVRVFKRSPRGVPEGVELVQGDATDLSACRKVIEGAATVYHCMNPPYFAKVWADLVPRFMKNLIEAAGGAGARLVALDNVYALGRPNGRVLSEDSAINPCSRKGEIRAIASAMLMEAHARGDVRGTIGRGSDFYGPRGTESHLGDQFWPAVMGGKPGRVVIDPDAVHTYHYIPDVAEGLLRLGTAGEEDYGRSWMLPCQPAETLRQLLGRLSVAFGREIALTRLPRWMLRGVGLVMPIVRELEEMMYQWDEPFVIDDSRFRRRFSLVPEDREIAARDTVTWVKGWYGKQRV